MHKATGKTTPEEAAGLISKYNNFLLVTHENPDGDALGSSFALLQYLRLIGKNVQLLIPEPIPEKYLDFKPPGIISYAAELDWAEYDFIIYIDIPMEKRAALSKLKFKNIPLPALNIDHHPDNTHYGKWNLVMPEAAAAAQMIFMIIKAAGSEITPEIAGLLLLGIVMDTGGFRFDNTSPAVMRHAAELLELKADYHHIINEMFFAAPLNQIEFQAELISGHLRKEFGGRLAWFYVPPELVEKYDVNMRNTEGLIESLRTIRGTEIVAIMQKHEMGFKISMRSKNPEYSVGGIARKLNGGGHEMAAGGLIKAATLADAERILITHVRGVLNAL